MTTAHSQERRLAKTCVRARAAPRGDQLAHPQSAETEHLGAVVLAARLQTILWKQKPAKPTAGCSFVAHMEGRLPRGRG